MDESQIISLIVLAVTVTVLISRAQVVRRIQRPGGRTVERGLQDEA